MITFNKPKKSEYKTIVDLVNTADSIYLSIYSEELAKEMYISTETVDDLIKWEKNREYLCVYKNNIIVWFASFRVKNNQTLWLSMFYINTKYQKEWFWSIFLSKIEKIAKNKWVLVLVLETDINANWAVKFYKKNKYIILDKYDLKKCPFDMILDKDPVKWRYIFGKVL